MQTEYRTANEANTLPSPSHRLESWRHFDAPDLGQCDGSHVGTLSAEALAWLKHLQTQPGQHFVWVDGVWQSDLSTPSSRWTEGLTVACWSTCRLDSDWLKQHDAMHDAWMGHKDATAWFTTNREHASGGAVLRLDEGVVLHEPIYIVHMATHDRSCFQRQVFTCAPNSQATIVLAGHAADGSAHVDHVAHHWCLGADARVRVESLLASTAQGAWLHHHYIDQAQGSQFDGLTMQLAGHRLQTLCHARLAGTGAVMTNRVVACPSADTQHHHALSVEHAAPQTETDHEVKLLVGAKGRGVCYSDVTMLSGVDGAKSQQTNRNLGMDASAAVFTQPRLVIHHDQVQCAHGATTGRLDPKMIRYMRARGLSLHTARALLISGFVDTLVTQATVPWVLAQAEHIMAQQWPLLLALPEDTA